MYHIYQDKTCLDKRIVCLQSSNYFYFCLDKKNLSVNGCEIRYKLPHFFHSHNWFLHWFKDAKWRLMLDLCLLSDECLGVILKTSRTWKWFSLEFENSNWIKHKKLNIFFMNKLSTMGPTKLFVTYSFHFITI